MKKITFTIFALSLFSIGFVKAQAVDTIPNGNFDRWQPSKNQTYSVPQGWDSVAGLPDSIREIIYGKGGMPIIRPVYDGKFALSLSCGFSGTTLEPGAIACKFPMKNKDPYLNFNLAYMEGAAPQSPLFGIIVWNSKAHDTLIKGGVLLGTTTAELANDTIEPWNLFSLTLNYNSADTTSPDSGEIVLQNAVISPLSPNSVLYVEKVWFSNNAESGIAGEASVNNSVGVYPNPFTNQTIIHYSLANSGQVNLTVYDMQGKAIRTLVSGDQAQGSHDQIFDANGLGNGVYMYKLQTSTGVQTGKLVLDR